MVGREKLLIPTEKSVKLRDTLIEVVNSSKADSLMLSGGIDSSALAALDPKVPAYTVVLAGNGKDIDFARKVDEHLRPSGFKWEGIELGREKALQALRELVRLTESYDQGLLNDIPIYIGMKHAIAELNAKVIRTGDFADVIFVGYKDSQKYRDIAERIDRRISQNSKLASEKLGEKLGIRMDYPYKSEKIIAIAKLLRFEDNVAQIDEPGDAVEHMRLNEGIKTDFTLSKLTLRRAMIGILPYSIYSRDRADLEFGSGMTMLKTDLKLLITDAHEREFEKRKMKFRNDAHKGIATMFTDENLAPKPVVNPEREYECDWCHGAIQKDQIAWCTTCGAWYGQGYPQ